MKKFKLIKKEKETKGLVFCVYADHLDYGEHQLVIDTCYKSSTMGLCDVMNEIKRVSIDYKWSNFTIDVCRPIQRRCVSKDFFGRPYVTYPRSYRHREVKIKID